MLNNKMHKLQKQVPLIFFIGVCIIAFVHNHSFSLWDQDEAAYAGFAVNMLEKGNWLIPEFMWSDVHRKPPLHFWNIAMCYKIFGVNEFSVRFPSAVFIVLTYVLIYFWGRRLFGNTVALLSAFILSTTLLVPSLAKVSVTDATLLFFTTVCAFALWRIMEERHFYYTLAFWLSFSLALLTKGPPIVIFIAAMVTLLIIFHPHKSQLLSLHAWFFLPLSALPLLYWGYLTTLQDGGRLLHWMIDWYVLKRIEGSVLGQSGPPGMHLLFITFCFIPYLMFLPQTWWKGIQSVFKGNVDDSLFLGAWLIAGWLPYELSPSKLPAYSLAAHVPLAILMGKTIARYIQANERPNKYLLAMHFVIFALLCAAFPVAAFIVDFPAGQLWSLAASTAALLAATSICIWHVRSGKFITSLLMLNLLFQFISWIFIFPQLDTIKDGQRKTADYLQQRTAVESTIVVGNVIGHPPSLPFYLGRHFKNIAEDQNSVALISRYGGGEPAAFILNQMQKDAFLRAFPGIPVKEISSRCIDRNEMANYYIVMNDLAARK